MAEILANYLTAIKTITPQDKEHTHRSSLENLLNAIKNELSVSEKDLQKFTIIHEPNNDKSGLGAPDFQVKVPSGLTLGYIENKRVGENLQNLIDTANKDKKIPNRSLFNALRQSHFN